MKTAISSQAKKMLATTTRVETMTIRQAVGAVLVGLPLLASGQTVTADVKEIQKHQQELEEQVRAQNARIAELEQMIRNLAAAQAAPIPAQTEAKPAANERPTELSEPATYPAVLAASPNPGPEYIGNLGFKLYESERAQIYMRLFSYARYLNQKGLDPTYTDFFGNTKTVEQREDIQLNKFFLPFSGWFLDPKFRYYLYVWSANTAQGDPAQVVGGGNLSYVANSNFTFGAGITSLPSVRSTEGQFPYWLGVDDRLTADEFFRGSYTSGVWVKGEIVPKVNYMVMLGNNLSTLGISASQLDNKLDTWSAMLNWLPTTGEFGPLGAFGDFEGHDQLATRLGVHFTYSTEDAQAQPGTNTIDNSQIRLTDGSIIFTPNLFGPGITIEKVRYEMASLDAGFKYRGYALEGEYYRRKLSNYVGLGTAGINNITDDGFQLQASMMLMPKLLQLYAGVSGIYGNYGDSSEFRVGTNYFPKSMRGIRVNGEWISLKNSPVGYTAVPYPVGGNGDVFSLNFELNF
jgi:outer membrane murein-binding lipoprotein Lpp